MLSPFAHCWCSCVLKLRRVCNTQSASFSNCYFNNTDLDF